MTLTLNEQRDTVVDVRCDHGHLLARVGPDGTVVVKYRDGCEIRIPPPRVTVVMEKAL